MKTIPSLLFFSTFLFMLLIPTVSASEIVLDVNYDLSEKEFNHIPIVNEDSRNAVQEIMDDNGLDSYNKVRLCIGNLQHSVTSPDGTYVVKGEPHMSKYLYKNGTEIASLKSSLVYPVAFSPDSKFFAYPSVSYRKMFDSENNPLSSFGITIASSETGKTVTQIDDIQIAYEDFRNREYTNEIVQIYWSADGDSIILDYVHDGWGPEKPDTLHYFVKCDIDYQQLSHKSKQADLEDVIEQSKPVEETYVGPSSVTIDGPEETAIETPTIPSNTDIQPEPSFMDKIFSTIRSLFS